MSDPLEAATSGQAWADYCDGLKAAGQIIVDHSTSDQDRIEGFRYLSRLTRGGLDSFIEQGSTDYPYIGTLPNMVKIGCDNPDAHYQRVNVSGRRSYRIRGARGTVNYLSIGAYSGGYGEGSAKPGLAGFWEDNALAGEGAAETVALYLSIEPPDQLEPGEVWVEMSESTSVVIIRQFFLDRTSEQLANLQITCLDPPAPTPPDLSAKALVDGLAMSQLFVHGCAQMFVDWVEDLFVPRTNTLEELPEGDAAGGWADPNQIFRHGYWKLDEGESLVISFTPPRCFYWNFQLNNLWEESLNYRFCQVTTNKHTATYEPDGSVRIIVSATDPGTGNWIDTGGRPHGTMGLRWNQAVTDVSPTVEVMPLGAIS